MARESASPHFAMRDALDRLAPDALVVLNDLGDAVWTGKDNEMFAAVAGFGLFAACCFLVLAILMIVYMSAVMEDKKEPLSSFRDRYGLGPSGGSSSQAV